jgi:soluble lytic murein transglycosylase
VLYLKFLSERFGSDAAVLAAYNGGPGNVKKWLSSSEQSDDRKFIEEIPFPETRNYVKKVLTAYEMYRSLYEGL